MELTANCSVKDNDVCSGQMLENDASCYPPRKLYIIDVCY